MNGTWMLVVPELIAGGLEVDDVSEPAPRMGFIIVQKSLRTTVCHRGFSMGRGASHAGDPVGESARCGIPRLDLAEWPRPGGALPSIRIPKKAKGFDMAGPDVKASKPKNVFTKPLHADVKQLFKALSKGIGHTAIGKWEELGNDFVEGVSAIGLATDPEELVFTLIRRSMTRALFELLGESASQQLADAKTLDSTVALESLDFESALGEVQINNHFLDRPADLPFVASVTALLDGWLLAHGVPGPTASAIASRLPSYFVYSLHREWQRNRKSYSPILEAIDTPFITATDRE
jgi:hypothetical protein